MKQLYYSAIFICLLLLVNACTGITPSSAVKHLAESIKTGNYAAAAQNFASESNDKKAFIEYLKHKEEDFAQQGGIRSYTIMGEAVTPDESKAYVRIRYTFNNNSTVDELISLVKSGGQWKYTLPASPGIVQK